MSSLRHHVFAAGFAATAVLRADRWLRPLAQGAGVILMFHHGRPWARKAFAPNRLLEITPEFLDRVLQVVDEMGFELVALDEIPARLSRGGQPFAALTFDDGYRDIVEHALPVLRRRAASFTVFVTTQFAEGTGRLWWLELEGAIAWLDRISVNVGNETIIAPSATAEVAYRSMSGTRPSSLHRQRPRRSRRLSNASIGRCGAGRRKGCGRRSGCSRK
jgi:peptidoglycan/xylan/chitin deacetylase (PgdA/CDA1 family)